ncbi:dihydrolipoyllysine-residue acetyltransferase component of pyruvate dehydrogenase complex [Achlya hypogyna]|uniref:Dihydrolipoamide acetyltransferase component of pyruvate dehydrogenase complex n=1 Tax=Achlya hypogyna TaxID=1202772 RepID=A0A1V9ZKH2_ACHHY|nr:dihydrolipoyllysine-residue acetyltransferase component of pyruvate dehydrogenase complex [Achlya hypogyna]
MLRLALRPSALRAGLRRLSTLPDGVTKLLMPALSPTMESGTIAAWLKKEGEMANAGDILCQVETDKATVDYEMQDEAVLAKIIVAQGTTVDVGTLLAYTVEDEDTYAALVASGDIAKLTSEAAAPAAAAPVPAAPVHASPAAAPAATSAHGHRVPRIQFLGKRSLLPASHFEKAASVVAAPAAVAAAPAAAVPTKAAPAADGDFTDLPLSNMRKIIAKRLTASKVTVPHNYASIDCEIDAIMKLRKRLKNDHGVAVSLNDFLLKSVACALRDVPEANCGMDPASKQIVPNPSIDISVAVATDTGLITPIVPKVQNLGLVGINGTFKELVGRARANKLKPEEFQGGSFTVSNLGGFGIDSFTAVINPPQACIMAVGRGRAELIAPASDDGEPRKATLLNVTLSSDRRVVDDVIAGQFLQAFKKYMEQPDLLMFGFRSQGAQLMTDCLLWRYVSEDQVLDLGLIHDPGALREYLGNLFAFPPSPLFMRKAPAPVQVVVDMYMHLYAFAKQHELGPAKMSTLLAIVHSLVLIDLFLAGQKDLRALPTLQGSFKRFQALLLCHSVERPPVSTGIFAAPDVTRIVDYVTHTYYRHFHLYQSIFLPQTHLSIVQVACMDIAPMKPLPPLQAAIRQLPIEPPAAEKSDDA